MNSSVQVKSEWSWAGLLKFKPIIWYVQYNIGNIQCQTRDFDTKKEAEEEAERLKRR